MTQSEQPVVLIVDDDEAFVNAQAATLEKSYTVRTATSGEAGLDAYDDDVDVLVLDRAMPDCSGDDVAEMIRKQGGDAQILMTTAVKPDVDIIDLNIDAYLRKPVTGAELREHVESALGRQQYSDPIQGYFSLANKRDTLANQPTVSRTEQFSQLSKLVDDLAREQIERREAQFQTLVQFAPVAIVTLDEQGRVSLWNPAAVDLFGWESNDVLGEKPPMFAGDTDAELEYARTRLFRETIVSDLDVVCRTSDGATIDVSLSAAPLTANAGIYGTLFVFLDVSERKQRDQQVTVMNRVLRHNVRNELNLLMGWLTELDRQVADEAATYVEKSLDAARAIDGLANKARRMQHILAEGRAVDELDLVDQTQSQIDRTSEEFPAATIDTQFPSKASIIAVPDIDHAIREVLENAIVHNDSEVPRVHVEIEAVERSGEYRTCLTIADDGPGIPPEERRIIFEKAEGQLEHGSGLGLWYLKWLLDRSDATLDFSESRFDRGSAVTLGFRTARASEE